ncbi:MAG: phospho-N-acetylmuramoyl-pentapeptide-transferase [Sarcina sp.]|nr:phospho-N-acetylmuramoyl-pentapeptide-transferase [Sarcina sp.]MDO5484852.1 phospho-N-acetylmuramoyl-pentapeptide-transferase [Sarcina sp.]MEE1040598.1 phospho-N-acetylmuramoyl-pentapeptide-transferase [Lachnospiraceae bacterium]HAL59714.1 phospho-N-acetylmuramoyl-pentapeptide-transferase [Sarcina sp.]
MHLDVDLTAAVTTFLVGFLVSAVSGRYLIPFLRRLKAGQTERSDGPQSHLKKTGTPNMGGLMILLGVTLACFLPFRGQRNTIPVLILTIGFGLIGFADDYIKVVKKRSDGLLAWQKFLLQVLVSLLFAFYVQKIHYVPLTMKIPFMTGKVLNFGFLNIPIMVFIAVATVNGTNFTDGVDGLASCVTIAVAVFFVIAAAAAASGVILAGTAMIGALMGFLLYNAYPAKVFMGDTGSLALGGFVTGMAYMLQLPLFIPIVGFIYALEVISVIIQVLWFRHTGGKRFFRMAPIHHHFEMGGWSEVRVVAVFTIVTAVLGAVAILAL